MWGNLTDWLSGHGVKIVFIIFGAWLMRRILLMVVSGLISRALHGDFTFVSDEDRKRRAETFAALIGALLGVIIWVIAVILILGEFSIEIGPLMTGAGVVGVMLAFGTQSLVKDFVSGMFIVLENQYRVGDVVDLDGTGGTVEHISIRTTVIRDTDGNVHFVPNGSIQRATNKTMGFSKINLTISVGPETDLEKLEEFINKIGQGMATEKEWKKSIIEPLTFLRMGNFTDKAIEILIVGKTKPTDQWNVSGEFRKRLFEEFKKKGISVPPVAATPGAAAKKK